MLSTNGYRMVDEAGYKLGCRYTTPDRFSFHIEQLAGSAEGGRLGGIFDSTYVKRVSRETAGLFAEIEQLLRALALSGHPQGVLSNACGEYVRAVVAANELDELPGVRVPRCVGACATPTTMHPPLPRPSPPPSPPRRSILELHASAQTPRPRLRSLSSG